MWLVKGVPDDLNKRMLLQHMTLFFTSAESRCSITFISYQFVGQYCRHVFEIFAAHYSQLTCLQRDGMSFASYIPIHAIMLYLSHDVFRAVSCYYIENYVCTRVTNSFSAHERVILVFILRSKEGNRYQNNTRVSAEKVRHESTYIILFLTRHNESINEYKTTSFTHRPRVSHARFSFCWWRHNRLLMAPKCPDNCDAITLIVISNSLDITNNAWVTVNNGFLSRVRRFGNDLHEWRSHEWKSLLSSLTSDKKSLFTVTNVSFYFLHAILCHEPTNPLRLIIERSFRHCCQGGLFWPSIVTSPQLICDVMRTRNTGIVMSYLSIVIARANWHKGELH